MQVTKTIISLSQLKHNKLYKLELPTLQDKRDVSTPTGQVMSFSGMTFSTVILKTAWRFLVQRNSWAATQLLSVFVTNNSRRRVLLVVIIKHFIVQETQI